ncbi:SDR family NAD(P)-dependent oxidoreductase [soil metagenome]
MKKTILITGAAGNLGKSVVGKFLKEGHRVVAIVSPKATADLNLSGDLIVLEGDLSQEKAAEDIIGKVIGDYTNIDALILLVGGYGPGSIVETDGAQLKKMYSLNFETAYFMARPAFIQMTKQKEGGRIVFIGARPALLAKDGKGSLAYALSKSLIFKLADFLNAEGASKNVLCSVVVPSTIDTPANRQAMPSADVSKWVTPEVIAEVISFATSDSSTNLRDSVYKVYGNA